MDKNKVYLSMSGYEWICLCGIYYEIIMHKNDINSYVYEYYYYFMEIIKFIDYF